MKYRLGDGDGKLLLGGNVQQFGSAEALATVVGGASVARRQRMGQQRATGNTSEPATSSGGGFSGYRPPTAIP